MKTSMNGIVLPEYYIDKLNQASSYFGDSMKEMILCSISQNLETNPGSIKVIQESLNRLAKEKTQQQITEAHYHDNIASLNNTIFETSPRFLERLQEANPQYLSKFIIENEEPEASTSVPKKEPILGDDEDAGDEDDEELSPEEAQQAQQAQQTEVPQTEEQMLQLELAKTDEKFVTVVLYDKIVELLGSVRTIKENISSSKAETELDLYITLEKYETYLEILNELIFVMDLNTIYYNVVNISIEVNDLLNRYLISSKVKVVNSDTASKEEKTQAISDLKINNQNDEETQEELDEM